MTKEDFEQLKSMVKQWLFHTGALDHTNYANELKSKFIEPQEKRIAELTTDNNTLLKENGILRKENAELRAEWQEQVQKATDEGYARTLQTMQLNKAKQFIRDFLAVAIDYIDPIDKNYSYIEEAEQFLTESEVEK